jgi:ATPase family associated with various cellular activities (AAA)/Winged helix domain, variant
VTTTADRDALLAELEVVRARLRRSEVAAAPEPAEPSALDRLVRGFGLTSFERGVLVLAVGPELVAAAAEDIQTAGGDPRPTFGLALSVLPDPHWGALSPRGPLRRWELVRLADPASLTRSPLGVDERVLHHLVGVDYLEPELTAIARPVAASGAGAGSLAGPADAVCAAWDARRLVSLSGPQPENLAHVAAAAAERSERSLLVVAATDLARPPVERERLLRLMEREAALGARAWAVDLDGARDDDVAGLLRTLAVLDAPAIVLGAGHDARVPAVAAHVSVPRLDIPQRLRVLTSALRGQGAAAVDADDVRSAAAVFDLAVPDAERAAQEAARGVPLWDACRSRARLRFDGMARVVEPRAAWDELVLPAGQLEQLRALVAAVRHRATVLEDWGFARQSGRGLGTTALFAGPSGAGKTLAAEVIAAALHLDLVVVDVAQVVSKYIGDTEKNLSRVFDAAEDSSSVLVFDEADTLFGRRTEVRDSHDRYANLEVGYLLQRMESFRGLAILTTNAKSALDQAFLRRLRVVVTFPYPEAAAREAMWRRAFPAATPTPGLDPARLAAIDLPGGGIAAAALTAAYLGADRGHVSADDVAAATRWELAKNGRTGAGH